MAFVVQRRMRQVAQEAQAIVDRDDDRGAPGGSASSELAPIVVVGCAVNISATVDPDQDRVCSAIVADPGSQFRREDVEIQAVLIDARGACKHPECRRLRADVPIGRCVEQRLPCLRGLRRPPTPCADGGSRVGDPEEVVHPVVYESANRTLARLDDRTVLIRAVLRLRLPGDAEQHRGQHGYRLTPSLDRAHRLISSPLQVVTGPKRFATS